MTSFQTMLAVALGGAIGALARFGVSRAAIAWLGPNFPWGTLTVNVLGSLVMGIVVVLSIRDGGLDTFFRTFMLVGVLGAFTTFSTFSLDVYELYRDRTIAIAGLYLSASVVLSVGALVLGLIIGKRFL